MVYVLLTASSGAFYFISLLIPEYGIVFFLMTLLMINGAGFILLWSFTAEGGTWIARRLGRKNVGIVRFFETGSFAQFIPADFSKEDFLIKGLHYKNKEDAIYYRGSTGIPYIDFKINDPEPINLSNLDKRGSAEENTGYFRDIETLIEYMMRNEKYRMLMILIVASIAVTAIGIIFLYFVGIDPINQNTETAIRGLNQIITKLTPSISPTPIPSIPTG